MLQELWHRKSSDDLLFVFLVLINEYVSPVKEVGVREQHLCSTLARFLTLSFVPRVLCSAQGSACKWKGLKQQVALLLCSDWL